MKRRSAGPGAKAHKVKKTLNQANPGRPRLVRIGTKVLSIAYSKAGMPHDCDAQCKQFRHQYEHKFSRAFPLMWDTHTGRIFV